MTDNVYRSGIDFPEDEHLTAAVLGCGEIAVAVVRGDVDMEVILTVEDAEGLWRWLGDRLGLS